MCLLLIGPPPEEALIHIHCLLGYPYLPPPPHNRAPPSPPSSPSPLPLLSSQPLGAVNTFSDLVYHFSSSSSCTLLSSSSIGTRTLYLLPVSSRSQSRSHISSPSLPSLGSDIDGGAFLPLLCWTSSSTFAEAIFLT